MKRRTSRAIHFLALTTAIAACAALANPAGAATSRQVFNRMYPLHSGGAFALMNVNGAVQIEGWDREQVEVRAVKTALHESADLNRVQIEVQGDGDHLGVNTKYPGGSGVQVTVGYEIHVPYRLRWAAITTVNGDVHLRGITGAGVLDSVNGSVEVVESEGRFSARTTNGDVRMQLNVLPEGEPMSLRTVNGSVVLSLPQGINTDLRVVNRNGDFHSDFPVAMLGAYTSSRFRGRLGRGGGEVFMSTVNGAIRVVNGHPVV